MSELIEGLRKRLGDRILEISQPAPKRVTLRVRADALRDVISYLKEGFGGTHVTAITGTDMSEEVELVYHIWCYDVKALAMVKVGIPKETPTVESIVDLIPGAELYEREVYDLLGVVFRGHPRLERLLLPEDWPEGTHPLRKGRR